MLKIALQGAIALSFAGLAMSASAEYPERTVRIIEGYNPGGASDMMARILAEKLSDDLEGNFIVENKPGGATTLAASLLASSKPDGHTMMIVTLGTMISSGVLEGLTYDYEEDLKKVAMLGSADFVLIVPKSSDIESLDDFIRIGKEQELTFASSGANSPSHLIAEEVGGLLNLKLRHVAYGSSAEGLNAVLTGEVDFNFSVTSNAAPIVEERKVKAIAVTSAQSLPAVPGVPPLASAGLDGYEAYTWYGMVVPKNTSDQIVHKLNSALTSAVEDQDVATRLRRFGFTIRTGTVQDFEAFSARERERWLRVAKSSTEVAQ